MSAAAPAQARQPRGPLFSMRGRRARDHRRAVSPPNGERNPQGDSATFELRFFDLDEIPDRDSAIDDLLEDVDTWGAPLTARLAALRADLERRYPWRPQECERLWDTPLSGTGLAGGRCLVAVMRRQAATSNDLAGIYAAASRHWVAVYDPQAGTVTLSNGHQDVTRRTARTHWDTGSPLEA